MQLQTVRPNIVQSIRAYTVAELMEAAQQAGQHFLYANVANAQSKQEVLDSIAEADVHGDWNASTRKCRRGAKPRPAVLDLFADGLDLQTLQVKAHPVVNLDRHDFAERPEQRIFRRVPEPK